MTVQEVFGDSIGRLDIVEIILIFLLAIVCLAVIIIRIKVGKLDIANINGRP